MPGERKVVPPKGGIPAATEAPREMTGRGICLLLAVVSSLLLSISLPPVDWGFLAWVGLAPFLVDQIFDKIQELNKTGVTVLLVEQNAQALRCADQAYILEGGEKKAEGTAEQLMNDEEIGKHYLGR